MAQFISDMIKKYEDYIYNIGNPNSRDWALMSSPLLTIYGPALYILFVKKIGPKWMANRKPFELKWTIFFYNFCQVLLSSFIFYEAAVSGWFGRYRIFGEPLDHSNHPLAIRFAAATWWAHFSKYTEFFDTIFFVLRKKNNQVSTLHVFHHSITPFMTYVGAKMATGGHMSLFGFLNSFVHIVMYTYYMLAILGPSVQKYLWWKKYITILQLAQFVIVLFHLSSLAFIDHNIPLIYVLVNFIPGLVFFSMFRDFYKNSYKQKEKRSQESRDNGGHVVLHEKENGDQTTKRRNKVVNVL